MTVCYDAVRYEEGSNQTTITLSARERRKLWFKNNQNKQANSDAIKEKRIAKDYKAISDQIAKPYTGEGAIDGRVWGMRHNLPEDFTNSEDLLLMEYEQEVKEHNHKGGDFIPHPFSPVQKVIGASFNQEERDKAREYLGVNKYNSKSLPHKRYAQREKY